MTGRKQGKANARYEAGWQRLTFALGSRSLFSPAGQTNRFGSSKKAPAQRYWALPKSQDFRMPGRAASVEKYSWINFAYSSLRAAGWSV